MSDNDKSTKWAPKQPITTDHAHLSTQTEHEKGDPNNIISTPMTPWDVVHDDLEMYRAIVEAFKILSSKHKEEKDDREERKKDAAQKHMKRLSLVAIGFDDNLAATALEETNYDIGAAVEYCELRTPTVDDENANIEFQ